MGYVLVDRTEFELLVEWLLSMACVYLAGLLSVKRVNALCLSKLSQCIVAHCYACLHSLLYFIQRQVVAKDNIKVIKKEITFLVISHSMFFNAIVLLIIA